MKKKRNNRSVAIVVTPDEEGTRLDVFCSFHIESLSRNQIQKLNKSGTVLVNGTSRPDHYLLHSGETIAVDIPPSPKSEEPTPEQIPIHVTYEDDDLIVINKEAGMVVHPAHGNWEGTLVNAVLGRDTPLSSIGGPERPGVVHRLDKDTSGVMVMAKTDAAYRGLGDQIKARQVKKVYHAIVWGNLGIPGRTIDAPIARHPVQRQKMSVAKRGGREAVTEVFVVDTFNYMDYIRVLTRTGRTHQIRVHLSHVSHPILGDSLYGGSRRKGITSGARVQRAVTQLLGLMQRQALHASMLAFVHPVTGERKEFRAAIPEDMRLALELLHCDHKA